MVSIRRASLIALVLTAFATPAFAQGTVKLAYINSQLIRQQAPGITEAQNQFQSEVQSAQVLMQQMSDSLKGMQDALDKDASATGATKAARQLVIDTTRSHFEARAQTLQQQMEARQAELVQPIMEQINQAIEDVRTAGGYTMIFDVGAQGGILVAADKNLDITDRVIARLRTISATSRPATAPATRPAPAKPSGAPTSQPAGVSRPTKP